MSFIHPELDDLADQIERYGLVKRKLNRTLRVGIRGQFVLECCDSGRSWVEADVFFEGGKVDKVSMQHERRHPVLDGLLGVGRGCPNDAAYFSENALNSRGKASDVFLGVLGCASRFHVECPKGTAGSAQHRHERRLLPARWGKLGQRVGRPSVAGLSQFRGPAERDRGGGRLAAVRQRLAEQ